jgi:hypothetical protein
MRKDHEGDEAPPQDVEPPPEDLDMDGLNQSDYPRDYENDRDRFEDFPQLPQNHGAISLEIDN